MVAMENMELWYTEKQTDTFKIACRVRETLHVEETSFQKLAVLDTYEFGRMLVLDDALQTTIRDEFIYHEMIAHVPLFTHSSPRNVAIIGGGDGGAVREVLKHETVEEVVLVDIDERVIEISKEYFPEISCGLSDERVTVLVDDGIRYISENKDKYDVVIVDSTDPGGPSEGLFTPEFYRNVYEALRNDGLFVAQSESPFFNGPAISELYRTVADIFPIAGVYLAYIPTYPNGGWGFTMGSKVYDPREIDEDIPQIDTKYYTPQVHKAAFALPRYAEELLIGR